MRVILYVEGGGDTNATKIECRKAFRILLEKAGLTGIEIVACGSRNQTFKDFKTELWSADIKTMACMLVDSEDPVDLSSVWAHLKARDGWEQPLGTTETQVQFMATCMETWLMADAKAMKQFFGKDFKVAKLLPLAGLERRTRDKVQDALADATQDCGRDRIYKKGKRSFQALSKVNPNVLMELEFFRRFIADLKS